MSDSMDSPPQAHEPEDGIVARWMNEVLCNSPASLHSDVFNYLSSVAVPELLRRLKGTT